MSVSPAPSATTLNSATRPRFVGADRLIAMVEVVGLARCARRPRRRPRLVLPGQPSAVQRRPDQHADIVPSDTTAAPRASTARTSIEYGGCSLRGAVDAERARPRERASASCADRERRRADGAHLAGLHQLVERLQRLVDRCVGIGPVHLVQVDVVGVQPTQAGLARLHHPARATTRAPADRRSSRCRPWWPARHGRDGRPGPGRGSPRTCRSRRCRRCRTA